MFGIYRYILAVLVIISHLGNMGLFGWYAVQGFFVLSGYLMTAVMHRDYGYSAGGMCRFAANRLLRLWPVWWVVILIATLIISTYGGVVSSDFNPRMKIPNGATEWFSHATLIFPELFPGRVETQISPPAWTLTIELLFYALIALGLSRTKWVSWIWLVLAIAYMVTTHYLGLEIGWRYAMLLAGALPFSIGALLFHYKDALLSSHTFIQGRGFFEACCLLFALNTFYGLFSVDNTQGWLFSLSFYLNVIIQTALILHLSQKRPQRSAIKRVEHILGDLSYPIYLLHMPIAFGISMTLFNQSEAFVASTAAIIIPLTIVISSLIGWGLILLIDRPVQKLRNRVRPNDGV